jgi:predicted RNA-binding protein with PIN domain
VKHYIIDGNNLIGKDKLLNQLQKKNKQQSREKLTFMLSRYFSRKKILVSLHFDGYEREVINAFGVKIIYSGNYSADDKIKNEIEKSKNSRNIILITSDTNLMNFGRVCSCKVIKSEEFIGHLKQSGNADEEELKTNSNINVEEYIKLFGVKSSDS